MRNFHHGLKIFFVALLFAGCTSIGLALFDHSLRTFHPFISEARLISSAGLIFDIAGIVQLEISGAFESILDEYSDEDAYPYGPPSHITRRIIEDPDTPIRNSLYNHLFNEHRTGFMLIVIGFAFQLLGVWLPF
jgi:hypothetical protein